GHPAAVRGGADAADRRAARRLRRPVRRRVLPGAARGDRAELLLRPCTAGLVFSRFLSKNGPFQDLLTSRLPARHFVRAGASFGYETVLRRGRAPHCPGGGLAWPAGRRTPAELSGG